MRTRNEFAKARELIATGQTDREIARITGVPRRTISGWRRGESRGCDRADCRSGSTPQHDFSKLDPEAYAYLLGLYLGDGCISAGRRDVWCLRITLDAAYPGIIEACAVALEEIFPTKTHVVASDATAGASMFRCGQSTGLASSPNTGQGGSTCAQFV